MSTPIHLCFIVDARSSIFLNWIEYFATRQMDYRLSVISSYSIPNQLNNKFESIPINFGLSFLAPFIRNRVTNATVQASEHMQQRSNGLRALFTSIRMGRLQFIDQIIHLYLVPLTLRRYAPKIRAHINRWQPDLVHAMRIPQEGNMATLAVPDKYPLLTSTWGNDFTLHADKSPILAYFTRRLMQRSNALHTDCQRDLRLARIWGFDPTKPSLVAPGAGGIHLERFRAVSTLDEKSAIRRSFDVPENAILVLNPRGVRRYVRNDVLIEAISIIVQRYPLAHFAFTGMKGERIIERLLERHGVQRFVTLLPRLGQADLARMYSVADIMVSLSNHDGTPNTMLEAMASGCFIVAGDIESIREWVQHGKNGLLCDPNSLESLVSQMSIAIDFEGLRVQAASLNRQIVEMRADYDRVMPRVEKFYLEIIEAHKVGGTL